MVTALTSRCNEPLVYENRRVLWLIKMNVCLTNCQYSPVFALTGLLRPSHASLSSYLQGKGEVASVDRLTDPICQAITSGRVPRRLSPSVTTQWNKYALAPVCVSPQRFYHRSLRARSLCKLLSVKKAQGKRKKNREGWSWGGIEEALSKHLRSDKSISVFNRVEEMCGRCGARGWESAKHRVESVTERLSGRVATNEAQLNLIMLTHPKFHINIATQHPPRHPSRLFTFLRCWPQPGLLTWASVACELWAPCSLEEKNGINMEAAVSVSPWGWRPRNPNLGLWHTSEGLVPLAWACRATLVWRNLHDEEMYNYVLIFFVQVCFDMRAVFMCADMPLTWTGVCLDL